MRLRDPKQRRRSPSQRQASGSPQPGFTLAEVAVTIVIVGIALVLCLQGLNGSKLQAAYTRNYKLARELGLVTLGEVGAGLWAEDIEDGLEGTYGDEGYPLFAFEVVIGEESFREEVEEGAYGDEAYDSFQRDEDEEDDDDLEEDAPYEKVRIKVTFPPIQDYPADLTMEQWFPWDQVYGSSEELENLEG